ncbi:MAG: secretin and TonB N-terminal domain-containing protein [Candidatus Omnitrophica bacterium]|nr:secretin and TonB N-terminal domain-containing protein [Candidatus Omnitrophota bacterium]
MIFNKRTFLFAIAIVAMWSSFAKASYYEVDEDIKRLMEFDSSKTISMDFKKANLNDVLKVFSQQSGMNFIADSTIAEKTVDIFLDKVPVEQALERILAANGLTYELKPGSNIFIVQTVPKPDKSVITKVYTLKNAIIPASKINKTYEIKKDDGTGSSSSSSSDSDSSPGAKENSDIVTIIKSMLTKDGSIAQDPRTNSLIVSDLPSQFPLIDQTIAKLDVPVSQLLIEAEILDISKSNSDLLGVKWGDTPMTFHGANQQMPWPFSQDGDKFTYVTPRFTSGVQNFDGLGAAINFLRTCSDTQTLARPRIMTLNNETAEIKITTQESIGVNSNSSSSGSGSSGTLTSVTAERYETGVSLRVTPQVNLDLNEITMSIRPRVVQTIPNTLTTSVGGQANQIFEFRDPEERGTKSTLRVKDGDTIVLGGLLRKDTKKTKTNVPVLSKLPIVGAAFRHKDEKVQERELVIFLTPHIMKDSNVALQGVKYNQLVREQDIPSSQMDYINHELSMVEKLGDQK